DRGVLHHDLHCGNILIRLDDDWPRLHLIDLQAVRLGRPLGWTRSRANLIVFNRWLSLRASAADRLRFWRSYVTARDPAVWAAAMWHGGMPSLAKPSYRALARDLEEATRRSNQCFWRHREQRWLEATRHNKRLRISGLSGYAAQDLDSGLLR